MSQEEEFGVSQDMQMQSLGVSKVSHLRLPAIGSHGRRGGIQVLGAYRCGQVLRMGCVRVWAVVQIQKLEPSQGQMRKPEGGYNKPSLQECSG